MSICVLFMVVARSQSDFQGGGCFSFDGQGIQMMALMLYLDIGI